MIILRNIVLKSWKKKPLSLHILSPGTNLIVIPPNLHGGELARIIAGIEKPIKGAVIYKKAFSSRMIVTQQHIHNPTDMTLREILEDILSNTEINVLFRNLSILNFKINPDKNLHEIPVPARKVAILSAILIKKLELIVLEEPLADLSLEHVRYMASLVQDTRRKGSTIVMITTNPLIYVPIILPEHVVVIASKGVTELTTKDYALLYGAPIVAQAIIMNQQEFIKRILASKAVRGYMKKTGNVFNIYVDPASITEFNRLMSQLIKENIVKYYTYRGLLVDELL